MHFYFTYFSGGESEIHLKTKTQSVDRQKGLCKTNQKTRERFLDVHKSQ